MKLHLAAVFAALVLCGAAHAIPPSVMTPYQAYLAAIEGEDFAGAAGHADAAYQAGVAERIDLETLAALAENRAQAYTDNRDLQRAGGAWDDLAGILERAGEGHEVHARSLVNAALTHAAAGDTVAALSSADSAVRLFAPGASSELLYLALRTKANMQWLQGDVRNASAVAREAFAVRETLGPVTDRVAMTTAIIAAIEPLMRRNVLEGAFYISLAADISRAIEASSDDRLMLDGWSSYLRTRMSADERETLFERTVNSALFDFELADGSMRSAFEESVPPELEGREIVDAYPLHREPARYPQIMLERGLEGFALIMFDVSEEGSVGNIRTLMSVPRPHFGEAAERAIRQWRYQPRTVDGVPERREGVVTQFEFMLR